MGKIILGQIEQTKYVNDPAYRLKKKLTNWYFSAFFLKGLCV